MNKNQLRKLIKDVLEEFELYSRDAEELLMLTCAVESNLGHYIEQLNNGPAMGIFQCEPLTLEDVMKYIFKKGASSGNWNRISHFTHNLDSDLPKNSQLVFKSNLLLQILIARIHYIRFPEAIPSYTDIQRLAEYWKKYYNTSLGKGTVEGALNAYKRFVR